MLINTMKNGFDGKCPFANRQVTLCAQNLRSPQVQDRPVFDGGEEGLATGEVLISMTD